MRSDFAGGRHGLHVRSVATARRERDVPVVSQPSAAAELCRKSRVVRVVAVLMDADEHDVVALPKGLLRAVAVVHVPIDDHDPLHPEHFHRMHGCDRNVVDQTEAPSSIPLCVMAWWSYQAVGVCNLPLPNGLDSGVQPSSSQEGNAKRPCVERCAVAAISSSIVALSFEPFDVVVSVEPLHVLDGSWDWCDANELPQEIRDLKQRVDSAFAFWGLDMRNRLEELNDLA
mmetsp:Transcript_20132/g.48027  ORF Transcript_20132/g.48027 Transcript_20132/m.48027 type:complete len:229 (+) Transcript_20132:590-1276(+)